MWLLKDDKKGEIHFDSGKVVNLTIDEIKELENHFGIELKNYKHFISEKMEKDNPLHLFN